MKEFGFITTGQIISTEPDMNNEDELIKEENRSVNELTQEINRRILKAMRKDINTFAEQAYGSKDDKN